MHTPYLNFNTKSLNSEAGDNTQDFDYEWDLMKRRKYIELVNFVLQSHKAPSLKEFRISLYVDRLANDAVAKWLEFVFARRVESLELDFQTDTRRIKLRNMLRESNISVIFFNSLKSLCLKGLKIRGEDIKLFLHNCPLLERLSIQSTYMESNVEVCGENLVLNHLDMGYTTLTGSLRVSAPNLTWLGLSWSTGKLVLENIPKLEGASFIYDGSTPYHAFEFTSRVSCCISQLKTLNLTLHHPQEFLASGVPEFPNLNKLVVTYSGKDEHSLIPAISALVWASPRLQEFTIEFRPTPFIDQSPCVEDIPNDERSPHQHLKVFEFIKFSGIVSSHCELVTYMSNKCVALQKIKLVMYNIFMNHSRWILEILEQELRRYEELGSTTSNNNFKAKYLSTILKFILVNCVCKFDLEE